MWLNDIFKVSDAPKSTPITQVKRNCGKALAKAKQTNYTSLLCQRIEAKRKYYNRLFFLACVYVYGSAPPLLSKLMTSNAKKLEKKIIETQPQVP